MGKALTGKLSCMWTGIVLLSIQIMYVVRSCDIPSARETSQIQLYRSYAKKKKKYIRQYQDALP